MQAVAALTGELDRLGTQEAVNGFGEMNVPAIAGSALAAVVGTGVRAADHRQDRFRFLPPPLVAYLIDTTILARLAEPAQQFAGDPGQRW